MNGNVLCQIVYFFITGYNHFIPKLTVRHWMQFTFWVESKQGVCSYFACYFVGYFDHVMSAMFPCNMGLADVGKSGRIR